jgi:hypothetical protein
MTNDIHVLDFLFDLGIKSGMPRYVVFFCLIQGGILFVPESAWHALGFDALSYIQSFPAFIQYYVNNSSFKNAMLAFWMLSPITLSINTVLWVKHINFQSYTSFLQRRSIRLKKKGKSSDYTLLVGILAAVAFYIWGTGVYMKPPTILGNIIPTKNRLAMLIVHAGAIALFFPVVLTMLITELRASLTESTSLRR